MTSLVIRFKTGAHGGGTQAQVVGRVDLAGRIPLLPSDGPGEGFESLDDGHGRREDSTSVWLYAPPPHRSPGAPGEVSGKDSQGYHGRPRQSELLGSGGSADSYTGPRVEAGWG